MTSKKDQKLALFLCYVTAILEKFGVSRDDPLMIMLVQRYNACKGTLKVRLSNDMYLAGETQADALDKTLDKLLGW